VGGLHLARALFDEAHCEAWTIRPELARQMQASGLRVVLLGGPRERAMAREVAAIGGCLDTTGNSVGEALGILSLSSLAVGGDTGLVHAARALGVPVEVMCNDNRGALMQADKAFGGAPQLNRRVVNDARGYVAELAAKATDRAALDQPASAGDAERLRDFLRAFGALDRDLAYRGSSRTGWAEPPGAGDQPGRANPPLDFRAILASDFWQGPMQWGELANMAPTRTGPWRLCT